ncbi:acyl-CoA thioesterase YbgC [Legionella massiliensis]|uniref:Acyl-CoA thioesterase YbgC n=1 Tax=Legionella massiliensis TaxID=1034943 RepID=A0A078KNT2_9GAMM|nr:thioesterase family protein [Legionella massiliensis]CDZ76015.1 acyl-CoA thioesterase YbgC [Legionella massiliensis]CEE11753.1 Long-chain acyl-CoA thioesterase FadM [Legionella massiliensis]
MTDKKIAVHQKTFAIEWGDMDALGHVNNGRYFDYFQQARIEWLESMNFTLQKSTGPVVIHVACTFLKPIVYPATITLKNSLHSIGRSSFIIDHEIYQEETLMTQGLSKIVWIDYKKMISIPLPTGITELFEESSE